MRFFERFASAYGTLMLTVLMVSVFSHHAIHLGRLSVVGFLVAALIYAIIRFAIENNVELFSRKAAQ